MGSGRSPSRDRFTPTVPPREAAGPFNPGDPDFHDESPNCFHGDNSTNFHFHGFHVSPQPGQDWVGLELRPFESTEAVHPTHRARGEAAVGWYDFDVDPLRNTQAEGTHWYHAHKHGSTALQVLNGLVGTFIVRGAFDEQLESLFDSQGGLRERLLVVQQLQELPPGLGGDPPISAEPLINGQADPIVTMRPGEIQRWRFVGATMQKSAALDIGFHQGGGQGGGEAPQVRQIAMDGVQFAPKNYGCQPILSGPDCEAETEDDSWNELQNFRLQPGNRVDLLVKAPAKSGRYTMTYRMPTNLQDEVMEGIRARSAALVEQGRERAAVLGAAAASNPSLLTLEVEDVEGVDTPFPSVEDFPKLPDYLADLPGPFRSREIGYEMINRGSLNEVEFSINGRKFDPSCTYETLELDVGEEWLLTNNSSIAHPFHIHTNPFQLIRDEASDGTPLEYQPPYIWRDVLAIPTANSDTGDLGEALIRYEAREFTGEFVNHCHILGHEDRGMMQNVQATCANGMWGNPTDDLSPECVEGNFTPAAPECPPAEGG